MLSFVDLSVCKLFLFSAELDKELYVQIHQAALNKEKSSLFKQTTMPFSKSKKHSLMAFKNHLQIVPRGK